MASWLFGKGTQQPQNFSQYVPPASGGEGGGNDGNNDNKKSKQMDAYRFDSSALERAANAAKDLEKSRMLSAEIL